jgi:hypothetical protein
MKTHAIFTLKQITEENTKGHEASSFTLRKEQNIKCIQKQSIEENLEIHMKMQCEVGEGCVTRNM